MLETFDPSNSSNIITSEDLIKAAQDEFRDGLEKSLSLNQEIIRSKKRNLELLIKE